MLLLVVVFNGLVVVIVVAMTVGRVKRLRPLDRVEKVGVESVKKYFLSRNSTN